MVYQDPRTGETLGSALREWREASGMTLGAVSEAVDLPITRLLGIEADKSGPDAALLRKLASLYSADPAVRESVPEAGWNVVISWLHCFDSLETPTNREMLKVVAASIRRMRHLPDSGLVYMRDQEADIIFSLLDTDDEKLAVDISETFALDLTAAEEFIERAMIRRERRSASQQPIIGRIGISTSSDVGLPAA